MSHGTEIYPILKHVHMLSVLVSGALFMLRGVWMIQGSPKFKARWVRVVPHIVDTVLLLSAISLAVLLGAVPFTAGYGWLGAKITALIIYIGLGVAAFKSNRPMPVKAGLWIAALSVFFYIVLVAISKSALPYLG